MTPHRTRHRPAHRPDPSARHRAPTGPAGGPGSPSSSNPADERAVQRLAARHIGEAAEESELITRAEKNTTAMLRGLLGSLGFTRVEVVYA
ncbi:MULTISPECIES: DUF4230 domain-containing protein [unclassified Streptomyces]|uniref:DUF4230 domain-containing protein n=1 Tax=unclassified Streptomyces TaxID=2593676 RepID=UPI0037F9450D